MDPYIGEIRAVGFNFAPNTWAFCDGSLLAISTNTALFSLIGTIYGGDGQTTFALPDMMARAPMGQGRGPGLRQTSMGQKQGIDSVTLTEAEMPNHSHYVVGSIGGGNADSPNGKVLSAIDSGPPPNRPTYATDITGPTPTFSPQAIGVEGGNQSHQNTQPFLGLLYVICLFGIYPPRN